MSKRSLLIAALVVLVGISLYFFLNEEGGVPGEEGSAPAVMEFSNSELHETQNGDTVWKLNVEHITLDANKNTAHLTGIEGYFKNKDIELNLKADKGVADRGKQTLYLEGHVEGTTTDGAVLHAENLTYDGKTQKLSTDKAFIAEKDGKILTADSFNADRVLQTIQAKGHAHLRDKEATN